MKRYKVYKRDEFEDIVEKIGEYDSFLCFLFENGYEFSNYVAIPWYVTNNLVDNGNETSKAINKYLFDDGCLLGEEIYIDVTW